MQDASCGLTADRIGEAVELPAGSFIKGAAPIYPEEAPTVEVQVQGFRIQIHEVTNGQFAAFVDDTGYVTDAERGIIEGRLGAGSAVFHHPTQRSDGQAPWALMSDATWQQPQGSGSSIENRQIHPALHLSKNDAAAYAAWRGGRLPTEIEWEYAATLGLADLNNPESGAFSETAPRANTWQGIFPLADTGSDGFKGVAPVGCYAPDRRGLYDMIGNVWEWTDTPYSAGTHTIKGGSFLCAENFCRRYRPAARQPQETDFSSSHIGFRVVWDIAA